MTDSLVCLEISCVSELRSLSGEVKHVYNVNFRFTSHFNNVCSVAFFSNGLGCFLAQVDDLVWPGNV
jgi:hypothetical protein